MSLKIVPENSLYCRRTIEPRTIERGRGTMSHKRLALLAGIEYSGLAGNSKECQDAVLRLIQSQTK